jgi:hypothetical protein
MKIKLNMKNKLKNTFIFYQREEGEKKRKGKERIKNLPKPHRKSSADTCPPTMKISVSQ